MLALWHSVGAMTLRFGSVGIAATLLYFVLALIMERAGLLGTTSASLVAYAVAALFSYFAHRNFTFGSTQPHGTAMPRFIVTTICGALLALALPLVLHDWLQWPAYVALAAVCIVIPVTNLVVLRLWVFSESDTSRPSTSVEP